LQDNCFFNINNLVVGNATGTDIDNKGVNFSLFDGFMDWLLLLAAIASLILFLILCSCLSRNRETRILITESGVRSEKNPTLNKVAGYGGRTKYLIPALFLANLIGIIILMILKEDLTPIQCILCWFFLL